MVDTGATLGMVCNRLFLRGNYDTSPGWTAHTPAGATTLTLFRGVPTYLCNRAKLGDFVYSFSTHYKNPFDLIMGVNILSCYDCCLDLENRKLLLKRNGAPGPVPAAALENRYTVGFEVKLSNRKLIVSSGVPWSPNPEIREGDEIQIDGVNVDDPEAVSYVIDFLSPTRETIIQLRVNGREKALKTVRLFSRQPRPGMTEQAPADGG